MKIAVLQTAKATREDKALENSTARTGELIQTAADNRISGLHWSTAMFVSETFGKDEAK